MLRRAFVVLAGLLAGLAVPAAAQSPASGRWQGSIEMMGQPLEIVIVVSGEGADTKATIDIPRQGADGLPLRNVRVEGERVHFELPAGPGLATFDGTVKGDEMSGTFQQANMKGTFSLRRGAAAQEPPPPYDQEEVTIPSGGLTLAGTLSVPRGGGPHPAVILITGSGAQSRDEEVFGFRVFKVLADHLTRAGLAVLRCDDRGVGGSGGSVMESTTAEFADDVLAQVKYLRGRPDIDRSRVGLLGHSEGGLVAPMVATRTADIAFVVLMSGPALPGDKIMLAQNLLLGKAEGRTDAQVAANARIQEALFSAARQNRGWDEVLSAVRAQVREAIGQLPAAQRQAIPDVERVVNQQAEAQVNFARSAWFRFFVDYDPAPALVKVRCPMLATFAERDLQVPADANRLALEEVLRQGTNRDVTIKVIPGANHLYQAAQTGGVSEYPRLKREFVPAFTETVLGWLKQRGFAR